jgi:hypothetical protein
MATVVPALVTTAISQLLHTTTEIQTQQQQDDDDPLLSVVTTTTPHPTVGLVDHVAIMPLVDDNDYCTCDDDDEHNKNDTAQKLVASQRAACSVAHSIRSALEQTGCPPLNDDVGQQASLQVLPYGMVCPDGDDDYIALADVRRTRTRFFQTISKPTHTHSIKMTASEPGHDHRHVILVGAPRYFVENYNVRLTTAAAAAAGQTDAAQRLCRLLRQSSGVGLPYVEALVLPYGQVDGRRRRRAEVACNLLRPTVTSSADIDAVVAAAAAAHMNTPPGGLVVERAYRVGTTARQCLEALTEVSLSSTARSEYDQRVLQAWSDCWSSQSSTKQAS